MGEFEIEEDDQLLVVSCWLEVIKPMDNCLMFDIYYLKSDV